MLVVANRNNLEIYSRVLLGREWSLEREAELIMAALAGPGPEHAPRWVHLEKLDKILGTHGVEGSVAPDVQYCNAGDTYTMTLLYYRGKLRIGDWGSIVEQEEA